MLWARRLLVVCATAAAVRAEDDLVNENEQLKLRLAALQEQLKEEERFTYIVSHGYIAGAENVYMETMEVAEAKQWCNANPNCRGFTFTAGVDETEPDDEVTATFKGAPEDGGVLKVEADQTYISYVKEVTPVGSSFGAIGDAGMQMEGRRFWLIGQYFTFSGLALAAALALVAVFACKRKSKSAPLLPLRERL